MDNGNQGWRVRWFARSVRVTPCAYRGAVSTSKRRISPILVYTVMRIGLFVAVWVLVQLLTPLRGLWAVVVAILVSGLVSVFLLNRQRTDMGDVIGGFFRRINARIDAASQAEDDLDHYPDDQAEGQPESVGGDEDTGGRQSRNQVPAEGTAADDPPGSQGPGQARQPE